MGAKKKKGGKGEKAAKGEKAPKGEKGEGKKKKKGKQKDEFKNMSPAEKKAKLEQLAAEKKKRQEEERLANIEAVKQRKIAYQIATEQLKEKDDYEQAVRDDVLKNVLDQFNESIRKKHELDKSEQSQQEWLEYLTVDGGPNPRIPPELTCALHRWQKTREEGCNFELNKQKDAELHWLLKVLDNIIKFPNDMNPKILQIFKEVRAEIIAEASAWLEASTREWSLDPPIVLGLAKFSQHADSYCLELWFRASLPQHLPRSSDPPSPEIEIEFSQLGVSIILPGKNPWRDVIVRAIWFFEDRYSDTCASFPDPEPLEAPYGVDLYEFTKFEYDEVVRLRDDQANTLKEFYANIQEKQENLQSLLGPDEKANANKEEKTELDQLATLEPEPMLLPREILIKEELDRTTSYLEKLKYNVNENEVNLRTHRTCGGILQIQLLQLPPQPKKIRNEILLTMVEDDKLVEVDFCEVYTPPPAPEPGAVRTPEEIEADIKRQESALEKLFLICIQLPDNVLWIEPPTVCFWNVERKCWTTDDIHDLKYNEDKFTINFRTGQLRPIGFATSKYNNLPYQGWELKPSNDNTSVVVTIMGAIIVCEFEIFEEGIKLKSLQNGATKALQDMVNKTLPLNTLIERLQAGGVDFFPSEDASNLINGSCLKHWTLESHLYHCMAHLCTAYNFQWSRWNVTAGRRAIVQQMREYLEEHSETFDILHVTPLEAILVTATELSPEYSSEPIEGLDFYPDLYSMIKARGTPEAIAIVEKIPWKLVENVKDLLSVIKPCSYS